MTDPAVAYRLVAGILAAGMAIGTLEILACRKDYGPTGLFRWEVIAAAEALERRPRTLYLGRLLLDIPAFWIILTIRLFAAMAVVASVLTDGQIPVSLMLALLMTTLLVNFRHRFFGGLSADSMSAIVVAAVTIHTCAPSNRTIAWAGLWFVALQSCLAYASSGLIKLRSDSWRRGTALATIVNTRTYGDPRLSRLLESWPRLARLLTRTVIGFECTFPLALVGGKAVLVAVLMAGIVFHVSTGTILGANAFLFPFAATYPAIWACAARIG